MAVQPTESCPNKAPPERVQRTLGFFVRHRLWHIVGRNSPATSCRDAAARRNRLGTTGIPLYDELKTLCVVAERRDGQRLNALLHCRATAAFDLEAVSRLLGTTALPVKVPANELAEAFGGRYGTVNPFSEAAQFVQVFDEGVLHCFTPPYTMMTSAGDLTWAVEFRPEEVIEALRQEAKDVIVDRITASASASHRLPAFGIITGNGPDSGMALWRHVNNTVHDRLSQRGRMHGDLSYPRVLVHSLPEMGLSMELQHRADEVWAVIRQGVEQLCAAGVDHIALACNTTPYFTDRIREVCAPRGSEFVSMPEVVLDHIRSCGLTDLTIIGIPVVAELGEYSAYRPLRALQVQPVAEAVKPDLQELGYMVKRLTHSVQDNRALNKLQHILRAGVPTDNVLIALTEISILLERYPKLRDRIGGKRVIDALRLYGEALAERYLKALPEDTADGSDVWT